MPVRDVGAVGAGDSFLTDLVLDRVRGPPNRQVLTFGMAAAGASAVSTYGTAQVRREDVEALYQAWCQSNVLLASERRSDG